MRYFLLIISILLFYSCIQEKSRNDHIVLNIQLPRPNSFNFKDVFDSIQIIPLELTENSILYKCDKMLMYKNKYYILDRKGLCIIYHEAIKNIHIDKDNQFIIKYYIKNNHK
ncbi:MAG: 6-bladed beta-propeller [Tannerella sp.]|nr:6-bladed beta-propeller [Tannerella sp.]